MRLIPKSWRDKNAYKKVLREIEGGIPEKEAKAKISLLAIRGQLTPKQVRKLNFYFIKK